MAKLRIASLRAVVKRAFVELKATVALFMELWDPPTPPGASRQSQSVVASWEESVNSQVQAQAQSPAADCSVQFVELMHEMDGLRRTSGEGDRIDRGIRKLLDFGLGPVSFRQKDLAIRPGSEFDKAEDMVPPGLQIDQYIFRDPDCRKHPHFELDTFARSMATGIDGMRGTGVDGIHILAGDRGAGKSTALNRIQWFCNNWHREKSEQWPGRENTRPLLIRLDLGVGFETKPFILGLLSEICRAALHHARSRPMAWPRYAPNGVRLLVGNVGRWCNANMAWAISLACLGAVVCAMTHVLGASAIDPKTLVLGLAALVMALLAVMLGVYYSIARKAAIYPRNLSNESSPWFLFATVICPPVLACFFTLAPIDAWLAKEKMWLQRNSWVADAKPSLNRLLFFCDKGIVALGSRFAWSEMGLLTDPHSPSMFDNRAEAIAAAMTLSSRPSDTSKKGDVISRIERDADRLQHIKLGGMKRAVAGDHAAKWLLVWAMCFSLAILRLPRWWWTYTYCDSLLDAFKTKDPAQTTPEIPYFSSLGSFARSFLPRSATVTDIRELETPFLEQQMKDLLRRCSNDLGGVVILIDDVDVLPKTLFAQLFQILRPIGKEPGVRCVICVPTYFHFAMLSQSPGDLHSTVRQSWLLGDAAICSAINNVLESATDATLKEFETSLRNQIGSLVRARLRIRVDVPPKTQDVEKALFMLEEYVWKRWQPYAANRHDDRKKLLLSLASTLKEIGSGRRELLRETERLLTFKSKRPFDYRDPLEAAEIEREFVTLRDEYFRSEQVLSTSDQKDQANSFAPADASNPPAG